MEISRHYETGLESEERLRRELKDKLHDEGEIEFSQLCPMTSSRREAASLFYNLLSLASDHSGVIYLRQDKPFGEILIKSSPRT
jgi:chromatin segregation and condensation protein Rec8/ScpA/Scc1 (kleisin family)